MAGIDELKRMRVEDVICLPATRATDALVHEVFTGECAHVLKMMPFGGSEDEDVGFACTKCDRMYSGLAYKDGITLCPEYTGSTKHAMTVAKKLIQDFGCKFSLGYDEGDGDWWVARFSYQVGYKDVAISKLSTNESHAVCVAALLFKKGLT